MSNEILCTAANGRARGVVSIGAYPSGEPLVGFSTPFLDRRPVVDKVLFRPSSMHEFMGGLFFVDALQERGQATDLELILPFVPGARQDRLNDAGDFLFTAKSIAREINARKFRRVTILDPHSEVTPALINRCRVLHVYECLAAAILLPTYSAIISPDSGAEKRAGAVAKMLNIPMLHGWKTRDVATGKISGFGLERSDITGRVLVVDDICDGGGTFIGLAGVLEGRGLKADLYVTHGLFTQGTQKLLGYYNQVFCTDSVVSSKPGVEVIPVCEKLI